MKKLSLLLVFLALFGVFAFADAEGQEEIDFLLFAPNSGNQFVNQNQAVLQLDKLAKYLSERNLYPGQVYVYGYAANAVNDIDPVNLSRNRALFVISELQKRGVRGEVFADPVGHGSVNLWGSNSDEQNRVPNRRVRILLDGNFLSPEILQAAEPEITVVETVIEIEEKPAVTEKSSFKFPWWILLLLLLPLLLLLFRKKRSPAETVPAAAPVEQYAEPAAVPETPDELIYYLSDDEIRRHAFVLFVARNFQHGFDEVDWHDSIAQLTAHYESHGYKVVRSYG